jgi:predicted transposase/invertase (TIGR01784 family)
MKKDITTKEAITAITEDIALYLLDLTITDIEFVDKELKRVEKREADIVARCKIDGKEQILHLEIQNSNDKTMARRMLRYYNDIKMGFEHLEVKQYIIYIGKAKLSMSDSIVDEYLKYHYTIIDMHNIDCEELIALDTPDALVLSILCDFKGRDELEVLIHITTRLTQLTKDDEHRLSKYMLMLETLSDNRDLKEKLEKAEEMLRTVKMEDLPSYSLGYKKAIIEEKDEWLSQGISQGIIETAITMIKEFNLSIEAVAKKLNISIDELKKHLK